jgi:hypothetical protein
MEIAEKRQELIDQLTANNAWFDAHNEPHRKSIKTPAEEIAALSDGEVEDYWEKLQCRKRAGIQLESEAQLRSPATPEELKAAADKLDIPEPFRAAYVGFLTRWIAAGMAERTPEDVERLIGIECDKRKFPSGLCLDCGCGRDAEKTVYCMVVAKMKGIPCPQMKWTAED